MPVWSKDIQYGAAAGFVIIVGIVAIQFGFSTKLVLAFLAGVGVLFCASRFDGLPRAAMLGASAVLLLLVVYDLATSCDDACQQSKAAADRQRAAQQQAQIAAQNGQRMTPQLAALCNGLKGDPFEIGSEPVRVNPNGNCKLAIFLSGHCIFVKQANETVWNPEQFCDIEGERKPLPLDVEYVKSAETGSFTAQARLDPPRYISLFH